MPMLSTIKLSTCMKLEKLDAILYKTIVGKFIFLKYTKLDITFVIGVVSIYMVRPYKPHYEATKHIFKYIKATNDYGTFYHHKGDGAINSFIDANWVGDKDQ
jgi:hypothetical protein